LRSGRETIARPAGARASPIASCGKAAVIGTVSTKPGLIVTTANAAMEAIVEQAGQEGRHRLGAPIDIVAPATAISSHG